MSATIYSRRKRPFEVGDRLPASVGTQEETFVASIRRLKLRIDIFLFSAGACPSSRYCCFSSFTVLLWMDPSSAPGWIRPLLCSRACPLLDTVMVLRRRRAARSTFLEGKGQTVRRVLSPQRRHPSETFTRPLMLFSANKNRAYPTHNCHNRGTHPLTTHTKPTYLVAHLFGRTRPSLGRTTQRYIRP